MTKINIYDLSPQKFEELVFNFLREQGDLIDLNNVISGKAEYDFSAILKVDEKKQYKVAIEAKHRRKLSKQDLNNIAEVAGRLKTNFDGFIFITSAQLTVDEQNFLKDLIQKRGYDFIKIYQGLTFENLTNVNDKKIINQILESKESEKKRFTWGVFSVAILILVTVGSNFIQYSKTKENNLNTRIENVSKALNDIKNLEKHLNEIKTEMKKTQHESEIIQRDYEKSQILKELTNEQQEALKDVMGVASTSWWVKVFDYCLGFFLGIAASVIASIIYDKIKRNKALNSPV